MCGILGDGLCDDVVRGTLSLKRADWALWVIKEPECLPKEFGFYSVDRKTIVVIRELSLLGMRVRYD